MSELSSGRHPCGHMPSEYDCHDHGELRKERNLAASLPHLPVESHVDETTDDWLTVVLLLAC